MGTDDPASFLKGRQDALAALGQQERDQYRRARDLFLPKGHQRGARIEELVSLGPHTGDTYIVEITERIGGREQRTYAVVNDGRKDPNRSHTLDGALLLHLALKYSSQDGPAAAWYAARVLGMPDPDESP